MGLMRGSARLLMVLLCCSCALPTAAKRGDELAAQGKYNDAMADYDYGLRRYGGPEHAPFYYLSHRAVVARALAAQEFTKAHDALGKGDTHAAFALFYNVHGSHGWGVAELDAEAARGMSDIAEHIFTHADDAIATGKFGAAVVDAEWVDAQLDKDHPGHAHLAAIDAAAAAWHRGRAEAAMSAGAPGAALLHCKLSARYHGDCGALLAQATAATTAAATLQYDYSAAAGCDETAAIHDRFVGTGRHVTLKLDPATCNFDSKNPRTEQGTYTEQVEETVTTPATDSEECVEKTILVDNNRDLVNQRQDLGCTKTATVHHPGYSTTSMVTKSFARDENHVTWTFGAQGTLSLQLDAHTGTATIDVGDTLDDASWTQPSAKAFSYDATSARAAMRAQDLDKLTVAVRHAITEFLVEPNALRAPIADADIDFADRLMIARAATGFFAKDATGFFDRTFELPQADVDAALADKRFAVAKSVTVTTFGHLDTETEQADDIFPYIDNTSDKIGTGVLAQGNVEVSAGARQSPVSSFASYVRVDTRIGGSFRILGEGISSQLGGKSDGFTVGLGASIPLTRSDLPIIVGISWIWAEERSTDDPSRVYINTGPLMSLTVPATRFVTLGVDFTPNVLPLIDCSSASTMMMEAKGGLLNTVCSPGALLLHPVTANVTLNLQQRLFLRGIATRNFGNDSSSSLLYGAEFGGRF